MSEHIDLGGGSSMTGMSALEFAAQAARLDNGGAVMLLGRPLQQNIAHIEGGTLVDCPSCGRKCWKRLIEPDPLPRGVVAVCTSCMLCKRIPQPPMEFKE